MTTIIHRLAKWAADAPDAIAQKVKRNGEWISISTTDYLNTIFWAALAMEQRGFLPGESAALFSYNCPEWVCSELAATLVGGMAAGIYPNSSEKDALYILQNCDAKILCLQSEGYFKKYFRNAAGNEIIDRLRVLVVFEGEADFHEKAVSFSTLVGEGKEIAGKKMLTHYLERMDANRSAFLIYTSGTTGFPKGVLLSHANVLFAADSYRDNWDPPSTGALFSFLPLSHIAEKTQNIGLGINYRYTVSFCSHPALIFDDLREVQPTILICVPRLWEKLKEGFEKKLKTMPAEKRGKIDAAMQLRKKQIQYAHDGKKLTIAERLKNALFEKLILKKIRDALGLGHIIRAINGAAALPPDIIRWYHGIGVEIIEAYALSESCGILSVGKPGVPCVGTVGFPMKRVEVKISDEGEILTRGGHLFLGYHKEIAATEDAFENGWLRTGDLGYFDEQGRLHLRGRKREILKTSEGKMVAPGPLEGLLQQSPFVSQAVIFGDGREYLTALLTLKEEHAGQNSNPSIIQAVEEHVASINKTLSRAERILRFQIMEREFSLEESELTPTMKIKRNVILQKFHPIIESLYSSVGK